MSIARHPRCGDKEKGGQAAIPLFFMGFGKTPKQGCEKTDAVAPGF
jgi:hypothetical protein